MNVRHRTAPQAPASAITPTPSNTGDVSPTSSAVKIGPMAREKLPQKFAQQAMDPVCAVASFWAADQIDTS